MFLQSLEVVNLILLIAVKSDKFFAFNLLAKARSMNH